MEKEKGKREKAAEDYFLTGSSFRVLGKKYGVSHATIAKWIHAVLKQEAGLNNPEVSPRKNPAVAALQKRLQAAELHNRLLEAMLDIGKEQYGIDLRKKTGTKRS